jgi:uncharacterized membrane protein YoaT (DUF817 family)
MNLLVLLLSYIDQFIMGDFKWTVLGVILTLFSLFVSKVFEPYIKQKWLRPVLAGILLVIFVWFGHNLVDPLFHKVALWYVTGLGEHMHIITK